MHERGHECSSPSSHWQLWIWCESLAQSRFTVTLCLVDTALGNRCVLDWPGPCMRSRLWSHWQSNNKDKAPDCWTLEHWSTSLTRGGHYHCSRSRDLNDIVVCSPASNSRQRSRNFTAASYHICYQTASRRERKVVIPASLVGKPLMSVAV